MSHTLLPFAPALTRLTAFVQHIYEADDDKNRSRRLRRVLRKTKRARADDTRALRRNPTNVKNLRSLRTETHPFPRIAAVGSIISDFSYTRATGTADNVLSRRSPPFPPHRVYEYAVAALGGGQTGHSPQKQLMGLKKLRVFCNIVKVQDY